MLYIEEHWQSGKTKIKKIPTKVYDTTLKEIIEQITKNLTGAINFHEIFFHVVFKIEGWDIYRLPLNKNNYFFNLFLFDELKNLFGLNLEALFNGVGAPDFLLINRESKQFEFVEIKASEKKLNKNQIEWPKNFKYDLFIVKIASRKRQFNDEIISDKEIIAKNNLNRN